MENVQDRVADGTTWRGSRNPSIKLTEEQVQEIRRLKGTAGAARIGARFGVGQTAVQKIYNGMTWAWLPEAA